MKTLSKEKLGLVYDYIIDYQKNNGTSPSYREIARNCNMRSTSIVFNYVKELINVGKIKSDKGVIIVEEKFKRTLNKISPIVGECACGEPILAQENIISSVLLPTEIFGNSDTFILKAKGRSMIKRGIFDGDLMVVKIQNTAEVGQVVIARVNGEDATAKIYAKDKTPYLMPANDEVDEFGNRLYSNIYPQGEWEILGVVEHVIHVPNKMEF